MTAANDNGGAPLPPPPTLTVAPTGITFTQVAADDAVIADGSLPEGTTLVKILAKLVGSSDSPVQVAAAATLPLFRRMNSPLRRREFSRDPRSAGNGFR